jgi:hypothetical protein
MITLNAPNSRLATDYLVEPLRASTAVVKFSGTFGASKKSDKLSATITAFSHFIAEKTACQLIFADLQGTCLDSLIHIKDTIVSSYELNYLGSIDYKPGEPKIMVLFDPMTHSPFQ